MDRYYTIIDNNIITAETAEILYKLGYDNVLPCPNDFERGKYIVVDRELVLNPNWEEEQLAKAKENKFKENETIRDEFLVSGVIYRDILWDSDIEQKLNISVQVANMSDEDTVVWVAMDGVTSLECTKQDLLNIGMLLTQMTAYVWQYKNPEIKVAIANAQTLEELEAIEIVYSLEEINAEPDNIEEAEEL